MTEEELTYKLLSGEIVKNDYGIFYFIEPGNWIDNDGYPTRNKLHREDGPAIEYADGFKYWYLNGKRHREDGPAAEYIDGSKEWYRNGELHREDGPAIEYADGSKSWYLNSIPLTEEKFNKQMKLK